MWSVWPLLIESALILLQTVPTHIDIEKLKRKLLENIDGILAVSLFDNCNQCHCYSQKCFKLLNVKLMHLFCI